MGGTLAAIGEAFDQPVILDGDLVYFADRRPTSSVVSTKAVRVGSSGVEGIDAFEHGMGGTFEETVLR